MLFNVFMLFHVFCLVVSYLFICFLLCHICFTPFPSLFLPFAYLFLPCPTCSYVSYFPLLVHTFSNFPNVTYLFRLAPTVSQLFLFMSYICPTCSYFTLLCSYIYVYVFLHVFLLVPTRVPTLPYLFITFPYFLILSHTFSFIALPVPNYFPTFCRL